MWPIVTLLGLQVRFLAYHDEGLVWTQRIAIFVDCAAILWLWPKILHPEDSACEWWSRAKNGGILRPIRWLVRSMERGRGVAWSSTAARSDRIAGDPWLLALFLVLVILFSFVVSTVPDSSYEAFLLKYARPSWQVQCNGRPVLRLTCDAHEKSNVFFRRNLVVREKVITANRLEPHIENVVNADAIPLTAVLDRVLGIDLSDRDLRYADFTRSSFPKADFRNTTLTGANFTDAKLVAVRFSDVAAESELPRCLDYLKNLAIKGAELRETYRVAELSGAMLTGAKLVDANLDIARLHGADLDRASLHGAKLRYAEFYGANLQDARLDGADLTCAQFHGAKLSGASVVGANFQDARLIGIAVDQPVDIEGAQFLYAKVQVGRFRVTRPNAADFRLALLAELSYAQLISEFNAIRGILANINLSSAQRIEEQGTRTPNLGDICSSDDAIAQWKGLDQRALESHIFSTMCKNAGAKLYIVGIEGQSDLSCVRNLQADTPIECERSPRKAIEHLVGLVCRDPWLARSVIRRAPELDPRAQKLSETETEALYPDLGKMIEERLLNDTDSCPSLKEELGRYRRRMQGL